MIPRRYTRSSAIIGLIAVACLFIAVLYQVLIHQGLQTLAADLLPPITQEVDGFLATQLADAASAADQFSPLVLPLTTESRNKLSGDVEEFKQIEQRLWAALLLNDHRRDQQSDQFIYADTNGRFIALWQPDTGHFRFSRRTLKDDSPAYRPSNARVIELKPLPRNFDPRTRPWYRHAVEQGKPTWVPVFTDYETGAPKQMLALPLYHKDGTLKGVVAFDIDLKALTDKINRALPHKSAAAYLINEGGQIITSAGKPALSSEFGTLLTASPSLTPSVGSNPILRSPLSLQLEGRTYWMVKQPIVGPANPNWHLIVTIPQTALVSLWWQQHGKQWVLTVAGLLLLPLLVFAVVKRQLKRLNDLKDILSLAVGDHPAEAIPLQTDQQVQELKDKVARRLRTDRLTGVLNRETFVGQVRNRCANLSLFGPQEFSLLFVDLNGFKAVNDTYGHHAGDQVLKLAARRMKQELQSDDAIARFGGDEFVIYVHGTCNLASVEKTYEKLQRVLTQPIRLENGETVTIGGAIGMAHYPHDEQDLDALMAIADERMYTAKRAMKQQHKPANKPDTDASDDAMMEFVARPRHARAQPRRDRPKETPIPTVRVAPGGTAHTW